MSSDGSRLFAAFQGTTGEAGPIYVSSNGSIPSTTLGTGGSITGVQYDSIMLQYIGNGQFTVLNSAGTFDIQ
jgi:hypothetical protein